MRKKNVQKKKFYIGDIFRIIVLLIALSVLLYPTVSNYLYEKNGARVISSYDENAVRLSESEKQAMLEAARQYNRELLGAAGSIFAIEERSRCEISKSSEHQ